MVMPQGPMQGSPSPMGGEAGGEEISPDQVKQMVIQVISRARQICEQYGLNFEELVGQAGRGMRPTPPPPPPSAPPPV